MGRPAPLAACSAGSMLLQAPLMLQANVRSASQNNLHDPSASSTDVANPPEDDVCAQSSDADTSDAPVSPTSSEQLKNETFSAGSGAGASSSSDESENPEQFA